MRKHYTSKQRSELIEMVRSGGGTAAEAAVRLGVATSTAYYWLRGAATASAGQGSPGSQGRKAQLPTGATFVQVVPSGGIQTVIAVRVGGVEIHVQRNFDPELLRAVVEALGGAA